MKKVLITALLTTIIIAQTSVAQRIYNPINGHLYEKFDTPMTWNNAKAYCESLGGYLATVTSQEEQDWIWGNLEPYDCYFGASDIEEEGVWKWVTGEPWDYTNWAPGQPDNSGGGEGEDVIHWWTYTELWNDISGNGARRFVCEYEPSGEVFVSPNGSDEDGDGSAENPYRTIQHGIDMSQRGDVVRVLPGTYSENITLVSDIVVLGSGTDQTIITAADGNVVSATDVVDVTLAGFTIDGQGSAGNGILCGGVTTMMMINDNIITGATTGIRCSDTANVSIWSNIVRQNIEDGVYCDVSANVDIKNNTIAENGEYGIQCRNTTTASIQNNIILSNSQEGIVCYEDASLTIHDNIIESNWDGIHCFDNSDVKITDNSIRSSSHCGIIGDGESKILAHGNEVERSIYYGVLLSHNVKTSFHSNFVHDNGDHGFWCYVNSENLISNNLIYNNQVGITLRDNTVTTISGNIIDNNVWGITLFDAPQATSSVIGRSLVNANRITNNNYCAIYNHTGGDIDVTYNYWGTTDEDEITAMMRNEGDGSINFIPFISTLDKIVGDASGDGTISALDAAYILQFVVGLIDKLPVSMSKSPQHNNPPKNYELSLPNLAAKPGERIHVPISISDATGLNYGGVIIKYDPNVLKVINVAALGMLSGSYWKANTQTDEVRFAFVTPLPMEQIPPTLGKGGRGDLLMIDFEVLPNTTGRKSPLIFDTVAFPESQNIRIINGGVTILPERTILLQNYPNPFNPETWIPFLLSEDAAVVLRIYNQKGQLVRTLDLGAKPAEMYISKDKAAYWDGRDAAGEKVASGLYFYTLHVEHPAPIFGTDLDGTGDFSATRKLILMK